MNANSILLPVLILTLSFGISTKADDSIQLSPTMIISAVQNKDLSSPQIRVGFFDSSFDYSLSKGLLPQNKSMCYIGRGADVCKILIRASLKMKADYARGAHDRLDLLSCELSSENNLTKAKYQLIDDFGGNWLVFREIADCSR
jgi:hypothetical protein